MSFTLILNLSHRAHHPLQPALQQRHEDSCHHPGSATTPEATQADSPDGGAADSDGEGEEVFG